MVGAEGLTYFIHINKNTHASNKKHDADEPAIRYQNGRFGKVVYAHRVRFKNGEVIQARPGDPPLLPCGARIVIATEEEPEVVE